MSLRSYMAYGVAMSAKKNRPYELDKNIITYGNNRHGRGSVLLHWR